MKETDVRYVLSKIAFKAQVIIEIKLIHDFEAFWVYPGRRDHNVLKITDQFVVLIDVYPNAKMSLLFP